MGVVRIARSTYGSARDWGGNSAGLPTTGTTSRRLHLGAFAESERALIRERQREGIASAKKEMLYKGRKPKLTKEQVLVLYEKLKSVGRKVNIAQEFNICREILYKHFRKFQSLKKPGFKLFQNKPFLRKFNGYKICS